MSQFVYYFVAVRYCPRSSWWGYARLVWIKGKMKEEWRNVNPKELWKVASSYGFGGKEKEVKAHGKKSFKCSNATSLFLSLTHTWMVFWSFMSSFLQCIPILLILLIPVFQTPLPIFFWVFNSLFCHCIHMYFLCFPIPMVQTGPK